MHHIKVTLYIDDPRIAQTPPEKLEELVDAILHAADKHAGFTLYHGSDAVLIPTDAGQGATPVQDHPAIWPVWNWINSVENSDHNGLRLGDVEELGAILNATGAPCPADLNTDTEGN